MTQIIVNYKAMFNFNNNNTICNNNNLYLIKSSAFTFYFIWMYVNFNCFGLHSGQFMHKSLSVEIDYCYNFNASY